MLKRIIILTLVLLMSINIIYAETFNSSFVHEGGATESLNLGYVSGGSLSWYIDRILINDVNTLNDITFLQMEIPGGQLSKTQDSNYNNVILKIGAVEVGNGIYGYSFNGDRSKVYIHIWFYDMDLSGYSGTQNLIMIGHESLQPNVGTALGRHTSPTGDNRYAFFSWGFGEAASGSPNSVYTVVSSYEKIFNYNYTTETNRFIMERDSSLTSQCNITINDNLVKYETSHQTYDVDYINTSYNQWFIENTDIYGLSITHPLIFGDIEQSSAIIQLNQTSYTSPEIIKADITLIIPDYANNYYRIKTMYSPLTNIFDYATASYNQTQLISTDETCYLITLNEEYYNLPIKIMIIVESYNKNTGVSTIIGESNIVLYNPITYYDFIYEGYVLDVTNNGYISNANIYFDNGITNLSTSSNNQGYFKIYLSIDNYDVTAIKNNYNTWVYENVFINKAQTTNIYLSPIISDINLYGNVQNFNDLTPLSNVKITVSNNTFSTYVYTNNYGYFEVMYIDNDENYTVITEYEGYYNYNELINTSNTTYLSILLIPIIYDDDIDDDINVIIDDLKEEIQPFKDLIFGLSEIVIDNPDYNDDNIISQNEYSIWINSFISIAIVLFIIIMVIGLKDRRSKR